MLCISVIWDSTVNIVASVIGFCRVCSFTGGYFCSECHIGQEWVIPARVIHNWDFRRYPVARRSAAFLEEFQHHPLLDLKSLNPRLYLAVEDMTQLQVNSASYLYPLIKTLPLHSRN
jgi:hypothetical protein